MEQWELVRGTQPVQGGKAIIEFLRRRRSTEREVTPHKARVACCFAVFTEIGIDHFGRCRDTFVSVDGPWLIRHRSSPRPGVHPTRQWRDDSHAICVWVGSPT